MTHKTHPMHMTKAPAATAAYRAMRALEDDAAEALDVAMEDGDRTTIRATAELWEAAVRASARAYDDLCEANR